MSCRCSGRVDAAEVKSHDVESAAAVEFPDGFADPWELEPATV